MIGMLKKPVGQLGNQLFQYNTLLQLSNVLQTRNFYHGFNHLSKLQLPPKSLPGLHKFHIKTNNISRLEIEEATKNGHLESFLKSKNTSNIIIPPGLMGEIFFEILFSDPRLIFKDVKPISLFSPTEKVKVGMHFRGGDFAAWNERAVMSKEYYMNAIDLVSGLSDSELTISIFTDDVSNPVVLDLLKEKSFKLELSTSSSNVGTDFYSLGKSDYIIASPSTFAFWSSLTNEDCKVIYSKEWIEHRLSENDKFWINYLTNEKYGIKIYGQV